MFHLENLARQLVRTIFYPADPPAAAAPIAALPFGSTQYAESGVPALGARTAGSTLAPRTAFTAAASGASSGPGPQTDAKHAGGPDSALAGSVASPDSLAGRLASLRHLPRGDDKNRRCRELVQSLLVGTESWPRPEALAELASAWVSQNDWPLTDALLVALTEVCKPSNAKMTRLFEVLWTAQGTWNERTTMLNYLAFAMWSGSARDTYFKGRRLQILDPLYGKFPEFAGAVGCAWRNCIQCGAAFDHADFERFIKEALPRLSVEAVMWFWNWCLQRERNGKLEQVVARGLQGLKGKPLHALLDRLEKLLPGPQRRWELDGRGEGLRSVLQQWSTAESGHGRHLALQRLQQHFVEPIAPAPVVEDATAKPERPAAAAPSAARGPAPASGGTATTSAPSATSATSASSLTSRAYDIARMAPGSEQDQLLRVLLQDSLDASGAWLRPEALAALAIGWVRSAQSSWLGLMRALDAVCKPSEARVTDLIRALWASPEPLDYRYYALQGVGECLSDMATAAGERNGAGLVRILGAASSAIPQCLGILGDLLTRGRDTEGELRRLIKNELPRMDQLRFTWFWAGCFAKGPDERLEKVVAGALFRLDEERTGALLDRLSRMFTAPRPYRFDPVVEAALAKAMYRWAMQEFTRQRYEPLQRLTGHFGVVPGAFRLTEILDSPMKSHKHALRSCVEWGCERRATVIRGMAELPARYTDRDKAMLLLALYDDNNPYSGVDMEVRIKRFLEDADWLSKVGIGTKLQAMILQVWLMAALPETPEQHAKLASILDKLRLAGKDARKLKDPVYEVFGRPLEQLRKHGQVAGVWIAPWNVEALRTAPRKVLRDFGVGSAGALIDTARWHAAALDGRHLHNLVDMLIGLCRPDGEDGPLDQTQLIGQLARLLWTWKRTDQWHIEDAEAVLDKVGALMTTGRARWADLYTTLIGRAPAEITAAAAAAAPEDVPVLAAPPHIAPVPAEPAPAATGVTKEPAAPAATAATAAAAAAAAPAASAERTARAVPTERPDTPPSSPHFEQDLSHDLSEPILHADWGIESEEVERGDTKAGPRAESRTESRPEARSESRPESPVPLRAAWQAASQADDRPDDKHAAGPMYVRLLMASRRAAEASMVLSEPVRFAPEISNEPAPALLPEYVPGYAPGDGSAFGPARLLAQLPVSRYQWDAR